MWASAHFKFVVGALAEVRRSMANPQLNGSKVRLVKFRDDWHKHNKSEKWDVKLQRDKKARNWCALNDAAARVGMKFCHMCGTKVHGDSEVLTLNLSELLHVLASLPQGDKKLVENFTHHVFTIHDWLQTYKDEGRAI